MTGPGSKTMNLQIHCPTGQVDKTMAASLYEEISRPVFSVALNMMRNREAAEDVLHDVYLKVIANYDNFEQRSDFRSCHS